MSIFGVSPFGVDDGPFGGAGLLTVLAVLPLTNNSFVVVWDHAPQVLDPESFSSASYPDNFVLAAVDPTYYSDTTPQGVLAPGLYAPNRTPYVAQAVVDEDDPTQVIVYTESLLEPDIEYSVDINEQIGGLDCRTFAGPSTWRFIAPRFPSGVIGVETVAERYRDFAFGAYATDGLEGYKFDPNNDIGLDTSLESLRKRLKRRIFTDKGGFVWAPEYGVGVKAKALVRGGQLQSLANQVNAQVLLEPDVLQASTDVQLSRTNQGSFLEISVSVVQKDTRVSRLLFRNPIN